MDRVFLGTLKGQHKYNEHNLREKGKYEGGEGGKGEGKGAKGELGKMERKIIGKKERGGRQIDSEIGREGKGRERQSARER